MSVKMGCYGSGSLLSKRHLNIADLFISMNEGGTFFIPINGGYLIISINVGTFLYQ